MADKIRGHMLILDPDSDLLPQVAGLELPTVESRSYILVDDDEKVCRVISEAEFDASYVDNDIRTFQLQDLNWLTLDVDNQYVTLTYGDGRQTAILLGSVSLDGAPQVAEFAKRNGIIYPIDETGALQFDATNTPNLLRIREWYLTEAKRVNDERLQIAEIVHAFSEAIGELGHASHLGGEMTSSVTTDATGGQTE